MSATRGGGAPVSGGWDPIHHEDYEDPDQKQVTPARAEKQDKAAAKADEKSGGPVLELTIPAHFTAGMWTLSEALEENTKATRELIAELRAARG